MNQLPFTSINYGTCILKEGQIVIEALLNGSIKGVGKDHRTPIFPCGIFQKMKGVNDKGSPNYYLYKLALRSTSKRDYPNYCNTDWSNDKDWSDVEFKTNILNNLTTDKMEILRERLEDKKIQESLGLYVDKNNSIKPNTFIVGALPSTMGAIVGEEKVSIKLGNVKYKDICIKNAIDLMDAFCADNLWVFNKNYELKGYTNYKDVYNCYVKSNNEWVKVYRIEKNSDFSPLKLYNVHYDKKGSEEILHITQDHPLYTNRGRVIAEELKVGDKLYDSVTKEEYEIIKVYATEDKRETYDFTTENDMFDVNGIISHNCRTYTSSDITWREDWYNDLMNVINIPFYNPVVFSSSHMKDGRGNICPSTIILPTLAMESKKKCKDKPEVVEVFMKILEVAIEDCKDGLLERFEWICSQSSESAKFMYENNTFFGYNKEEGIKSALRHGSLAIGQLGLAECLQILVGCNQLDPKGMELAKRIEQMFKDKCKEYKEKYKLNFGVYYTPAESLCYNAMKKFKKKYGIIPNVSDRDYFTNSIHVPVWEKVSPFKKIDIESQLTGYSSAGCITYIELDSNADKNLDALEQFVDYAMDKDIPYFALNLPIDFCTCCSYSGQIDNSCPKCGNSDDTKIQRLRRVTGYLTGDYKSAFNLGKQKEVEDRVKHTDYMGDWKGADC